MKIKYALLTAFLFNIVACSNKFSKYKDQVDVTKILVNNIIENDTAAIKKMLGVNPHDIGLSDEQITSSIGTINNAIAQANNSDLKEYKFREYPKNSPNLVDIIVPLKKGNEDDEYIIVSFVKYIEKGKIYYFQLIKSIPKNLDDLSPPK